MKYITSTKNDWVKYVKSLHKKKNRHELGCFLVEGLRNVETTIEAGGIVEALIVSDDFKRELLWDFETIKVTAKVFSDIAQTENSQGLMAIVKFPELGIDLEKAKYLLYLDRVQDPGNMGTIIRTADAAGFDGVIVSKGCVDPFNDKVVRSAMGSLFAMDIVIDENIEHFKSLGYQIVTTHLSGEDYFNEVEYSQKVILVIGNEANGVSDEIVAMSDCLVKIPMRGSAESLNAAIAAGILMYQIIE